VKGQNLAGVSSSQSSWLHVRKMEFL
jgi:hypothetical protein